MSDVSHMKLRLVKLRGLSAYAIVVMIDNVFRDVCFYGARVALQIHTFDRDMQTELNVNDMSDYDREQLIRPLLRVSQNVMGARRDLSNILAARLLSPHHTNAFQQLWDAHPDVGLWETLVIDAELPHEFRVEHQELQLAGIEPYRSGPSTRIRVREPHAPDRFQRLANILREGASKSPSALTSVLGLDPLKPGGWGQEPERMTAADWERVRQSGHMPGDRDWRSEDQKAFEKVIKGEFN